MLEGGGYGPVYPALDLPAMWHMPGKERREAVRCYLHSIDMEAKRGAVRKFEQAMGLIWYYHSSNLVLSAMGRCTLQRIVDDDDDRCS